MCVFAHWRALPKWFRIFDVTLDLSYISFDFFPCRFSASFDERVDSYERRKKENACFWLPGVSVEPIHVSHVRVIFWFLWFASSASSSSFWPPRLSSSSSSNRSSSQIHFVYKFVLLTTLEWDAIKPNELKESIMWEMRFHAKPKQRQTHTRERRRRRYGNVLYASFDAHEKNDLMSL